MMNDMAPMLAATEFPVDFADGARVATPEEFNAGELVLALEDNIALRQKIFALESEILKSRINEVKKRTGDSKSLLKQPDGSWVVIENVEG